MLEENIVHEIAPEIRFRGCYVMNSWGFICNKCNEIKTPDEKASLGPRSNWLICKECKRVYNRAKYRENRVEKLKATWRFNLKRKYGLTLETYNKTVEFQENKCAICKVDFVTLDINPSVDHCHTTGKVRGLLCGPCNTGLGFFRDQEDRLIRAAEYLKFSKKSRDLIIPPAFVPPKELGNV